MKDRGTGIVIGLAALLGLGFLFTKKAGAVGVLELSNLTISPAQVNVGQIVTIAVTATNPTEEPLTGRVVCTVN